MAQIQAKWPKSGQNLGIGGHNIVLRGQNNVPRARIGVFWPQRRQTSEEGAGGTDGWTDEWTDEWKSPCVLQDFVPFGAAAQKGKQEKKKEERKEGRNSESKRYVQTDMFNPEQSIDHREYLAWAELVLGQLKSLLIECQLILRSSLINDDR